jgi:hypothetical protein
MVQDLTLPKQSATALGETRTKLETLLQTRNDEFSYIDYIVYKVNHEYTPTSLSLQNLKGQDAAK